jgi:2-polyprenyl-6-methoxyphenol hydroxylase-like FAD-dependent oxidoreductase
VIKDDTYNHRAAHWSDLHHLIHDALPSGIVRFGHEVLSFEELDSDPRVRVRVSNGDDTVEEVEADFMVAADGSMSQTREKFLPNEKRRYLRHPNP